MPDLVSIYLQYLESREGWILESRIDQQGGTEVYTLLVQHVLSCILSSACLHGFLQNVDITHETICGGKYIILHELRGCG